jgi:hypothetical protein
MQLACCLASAAHLGLISGGAARVRRLQVLAHGLGWRNVSLGAIKRRVAAPYGWTKTFKSRAAAEQIKQMNGLDQQLVDFARLINRLDGFFFNATAVLQQRQWEAAGSAEGKSAWQHAAQELRGRVVASSVASGSDGGGADALELQRPHGLFTEYEPELLATTCGYVGVRSKSYYLKHQGPKARP